MVETRQVASTSNTRPEADDALTRRVPRWVIVFVLIILLIVLTVATIEITNNGMGNMHMAIPRHLLLALTYGGHRR